MLNFLCSMNLSFRNRILRSSASRRVRLLLAVLMLHLATQAQFSKLYVYGYMSDYDSDSRIMTYQVHAQDTIDGTVAASVLSNDTGGYEMELPYDGVFRVTFTADGYVPKTFIIDDRSVPAKTRREGMGMMIVVTLFRPFVGMDTVLTELPIGICRYNKWSGFIKWDAAYSKGIQEKWKRSRLKQH